MFINIFNIDFNLFWANILLKFSRHPQSLLFWSISPVGFEELQQEHKNVLVKIMGYLIFKIKRFSSGHQPSQVIRQTGPSPNNVVLAPYN